MSHLEHLGVHRRFARFGRGRFTPGVDHVERRRRSTHLDQLDVLVRLTPLTNDVRVIPDGDGAPDGVDGDEEDGETHEATGFPPHGPGGVMPGAYDAQIGADSRQRSEQHEAEQVSSQSAQIGRTSRIAQPVCKRSRFFGGFESVFADLALLQIGGTQPLLDARLVH